MSNNIEGKVVVITGASSGLGEASAGISPHKARPLCWVRAVTIVSSHWRAN
jgi:NADP-dependent 3-hydroxy acid dehydrogenase YdfG